VNDAKAARGDLWFQPFAIPCTPSIQSLAAQTKRSLEARENRKRIRKPADELAFATTVDTIIANLVISLSEPEVEAATIAISLAHKVDASGSRYLNPLLPVKTLRHTLEAMQALGILEMSLGRKGTSTTFKATPEFAAEVQSREIGLADVGHDWERDEVIVLTQKVVMEDQDGPSYGAPVKPLGERVDYQDDDNTQRMREAIRSLVIFVSRLDIAFLPDGQLPHVHTNQRHLKRYFNLRPPQPTPAFQGLPLSSTPSSPASSNTQFNHGGRLFGNAFWLSLRKDRRRNSLRINCEPVVECDLSGLFPRLCYRLLGVTMPLELQDDPYAIQGFPAAHRSSLKMAFNAFLFHDKPLKRLPQKIAKGMPEGWTAGKLRGAILASHPALEPLLNGSRIGFHLLRIESDILMQTMSMIQSEGLAALPLHDGVIVPRSQAERVRELMQAAANRIAGEGLRVELKE
jgi:hypothetical protein